MQKSIMLLVLGGLTATTGAAETVDRIVAVVNHQIITLGDVEQERKFLEIGLSNSETVRIQREKELQIHFEIAQRLIEQALIRQQIEQFPGIEVSSDEIQSQIASIREKVGSGEEWEQLLNGLHITLEDLEARVSWQLQVVKFFDYRFRQFVVVDQKEIERYYTQKFLPQLATKGGKEQASLPEVEEKIRDLLTEDKVNGQIEEWIKSLRDSATIEMFF